MAWTLTPISVLTMVFYICTVFVKLQGKSLLQYEVHLLICLCIGKTEQLKRMEKAECCWYSFLKLEWNVEEEMWVRVRKFEATVSRKQVGLTHSQLTSHFCR